MREFSVPASFTVGKNDNILNSISKNAEISPDYIIFRNLVDNLWVEMTCAEVASIIRLVAKGLIALGINSGDRVVILSSTRYEWTIIDFAILSVDAVTVPIYETSSAEQIQFILNNSKAKIMFIENEAHADTIKKLRWQVPELTTTLQIDSMDAPALDIMIELGKVINDSEFYKRLSNVYSTNLATLVYTSGTTGRPKGCKLTHSNLLYEALGAKSCFFSELSTEERMLVFLPLSHILARSITIAAFINRVTLSFTNDIKNLIQKLCIFKPTLVVSTPRIFEKLYNLAEQNARNKGKWKIYSLATQTAIEWSKSNDSGSTNLLLRTKHKLFDKLIYSKFRLVLGGKCRTAISGGAPLGTRLGHFYRGVGLSIYEGYGLTETNAAITVNRINDLKVGSVGRLMPGNKMRIANDGEILVKGGLVFSGYWDNETETENSFSNGWFHTGDLGSIDENGFLTIVGRKKEIIVTANGKNVIPAFLEERLRVNPLISQAMVFGDRKPFIVALITIDNESFVEWKKRNRKGVNVSVRDLVSDPELLEEINSAVREANKAVSRAESICKFCILPVDFTEDTGELTPTLKIKRKVVSEKFASNIESLYS